MMINLDFECIAAAQAMLDAGNGDLGKQENLATNGLGVLLEHGPYGLMLFFFSHKDKKIAEVVKAFQKQLLEILFQARIRSSIGIDEGEEPPTDFAGTQALLQRLSQDIDAYLLVKTIWEQTLTYARYHAKSLGNQAAAQDPAPDEAPELEPGA
jgi:hypothetical protein